MGSGSCGNVIAALASFFIPGLGQLLQGRWLLAGLMFLLTALSFGWLHEQGGFTFDEAYYLDPDTHLQREQQIHAFVASRFPNDPVYNMEAHLGRIEYRQQPSALVGALQPNLLLGAAVDATPHRSHHGSCCGKAQRT